MPDPQKLLPPSPPLGKEGKERNQKPHPKEFTILFKGQGLSNSLNIELKKLIFRCQLRCDFFREAYSAAQPPGYLVPLLWCSIRLHLNTSFTEIAVYLCTSLLTPLQVACSERKRLHLIYSLINI